LIYGDSITPERQRKILERLSQQKMASSNVVLGIGSFTYQYVTRDTYGFAMKATYGEKNGVGQDIFKEPKTDDGVKNSAKGLLGVFNDANLLMDRPFLLENLSWGQEAKGILQTIFKNGVHYNFQTLKEIRARVQSQL
jgi:nicotinamide phosphoribosyltransferase